ncbi:MAG TPA: hypothetical protein VFD85_06850 [Gemmatimonadales bacterium]|nr:hypothetical protein [Gemmatimonadales bacterium]
MPTGWIWQQLIAHFVSAAPWLVGLFGGLALVNFGPLGNAIRARLTRGGQTEDDPRLDTIAADVSQVLERLDYLERLAVQDGRHVPLPPAGKTTPKP